jgi:hypothetical protein
MDKLIEEEEIYINENKNQNIKYSKDISSQKIN